MTFWVNPFVYLIMKMTSQGLLYSKKLFILPCASSV